MQDLQRVEAFTQEDKPPYFFSFRCDDPEGSGGPDIVVFAYRQEPKDSLQRLTTQVAVSNLPWRTHFHSPAGLSWGYLGSGPADTALNLLLCITDKSTAQRHYQACKERFVACLDLQGGTIRLDEVREWLLARTQAAGRRGFPQRAKKSPE